MKKVTKALLLALIFNFQFSIFNTAQAQLHQSVYLNGNIPVGDLGSSVSSSHSNVPLTCEEIGKDASLGFGIGYRVSYRLDVGMGKVAPFANIDILWNTISSEWSDQYSLMYFSTPTYFNVPLLAGVSYIYDQLSWDDITLFGEFGIGTDFFWITPEGGTTDIGSGSVNMEYAYKANFAFSWMIGAGAFFGDHVSAGLYYYGLGTHNIDYTKATLEDNSFAAAEVAGPTFNRQRRSNGSLMLRIGFHF